MKACLQCRSSKVKCDLLKPCTACFKRGCPELCKEDENQGSCLYCKQKKLKCNKQRPCDQCLKRSRGDDCCTAEIRTPAVAEAKGPDTPSSEHSVDENTFAMMPSNQADISPIFNAVDRPLHSPLKIVFPDTSQFRMRESLKLQHVVFRRVWETGYNISSLTRLFNKLPYCIRQALDDGLFTLERLRQLRNIEGGCAEAVPVDMDSEPSIIQMTDDEVPGCLLYYELNAGVLTLHRLYQPSRRHLYWILCI
ncbi:hypothetical protein GUITHDRAFT_153412 [Guillardia theta CCMP2712]|uniref:Zn(2)-C6 fungal-type domain-containing protein n=1 Tax=Guillardia theta (strain CCMP2712) TaxID=905079 RepID=L1J4B9_GUITC|nr:hypothetical protein GUITHDRAFT_153412 [Guillardia theta CCMP2712]EKX42979.1 hypothetical protein GUITHDRAFT_153412 [Guillardia theta CCMP2712]|eukprot:XP_005829959.1 hypothetical protein GUITHDRAFT_153412 [Guillardia theta CCMP2712]